MKELLTLTADLSYISEPELEFRRVKDSQEQYHLDHVLIVTSYYPEDPTAALKTASRIEGGVVFD